MKPQQVLTGAVCVTMLALLLAACAPAAPAPVQPCPTAVIAECPTPVPPEPVECTPASPAFSDATATAEALTERYIEAWDNRDLDLFFSVHTDDALIIDHSSREEYFMDLSKSWYRAYFANRALEVTVNSYFVSADGRFAVLEGMTTDFIKDGKAVTVPAATIMEFKDGKIIKRTMYYRGSTDQ